MKTIECPICGGEASAVRLEREVHIGKRTAVVDDEFFRCAQCGEELYEPGQLDAVMLRASDAIRRDLGLLRPLEIKALRESLELSQAEFERLLGVGMKTVVRWEKGTVFQNQATDALLRAIREVDGVAEFLSERTGVALPVRTGDTSVPEEFLLFDSGHDLVDDDRYVATREEPPYKVTTGWFRRAA
jgi:HTH-type transcriptional regulator / antitoxin MqsA